jgi:hypothetical protein
MSAMASLFTKYFAPNLKVLHIQSNRMENFGGSLDTREVVKSDWICNNMEMFSCEIGNVPRPDITKEVLGEPVSKYVKSGILQESIELQRRVYSKLARFIKSRQLKLGYWFSLHVSKYKGANAESKRAFITTFARLTSTEFEVPFVKVKYTYFDRMIELTSTGWFGTGECRVASSGLSKAGYAHQAPGAYVGFAELFGGTQGAAVCQLVGYGGLIRLRQGADMVQRTLAQVNDHDHGPCFGG